MSCYVNTVKGPVSPRELGITLMHEHLAELNNSMKRCYADWFHADIFLEKIKPVFQKAKKYGLSTYVDQTAVNMGRDIRFIKRVSESCDVNIVAVCSVMKRAGKSINRMRKYRSCLFGTLKRAARAPILRREC